MQKRIGRLPSAFGKLHDLLASANGKKSALQQRARHAGCLRNSNRQQDMMAGDASAKLGGIVRVSGID